ncbi:MAG TPA: hypothetical protein VNX68_08170 [Nitrosopumilaceae archaeon]|jgi:hypothetical protein|nr:hypothetical protein [Nitrosopumilaceae archaeon]
MILGNILLMFNSISEGGEPPILPASLDFASGIFAAFLLALSLLAYKRTKMKRLLFVSAAFGLFAFRAIIPRLDLFLPNLDLSTSIETILSITGFVILGLFFLAIVKKQKS